MPEDTDEKRPADAAERSAEADEEQVDEQASKEDAPDKGASNDDASDAAGAQDDEEEDDEEASAPAPKKKTAAKPSRVAAPPPSKKKKKLAPAKFVMPPEKEIGAPSRQTLVLLGIMAFATLAMWGSARFACNAHPAQTRKPREVSTAELSREPKDAALEMQQRWNSYDFAGALALAKGSIAEELQKAKADCDKDATGCAAKKKSVEGKVLASAALLSRGPGAAKVRVVSRGGAGGEATIVYALEQDGSSWKVSGRTEAPAPAPVPTPAPSAAPAPSASAAP